MYYQTEYCQDNVYALFGAHRYIRYTHNINTIVPHNQVKKDTFQLHGAPFATSHMTGKKETIF